MMVDSGMAAAEKEDPVKRLSQPVLVVVEVHVIEREKVKCVVEELENTIHTKDAERLGSMCPQECGRWKARSET